MRRGIRRCMIFFSSEAICLLRTITQRENESHRAEEGCTHGHSTDADEGQTTESRSPWQINPHGARSWNARHSRLPPAAREPRHVRVRTCRRHLTAKSVRDGQLSGRAAAATHVHLIQRSALRAPSAFSASLRFTHRPKRRSACCSGSRQCRSRGSRLRVPCAGHIHVGIRAGTGRPVPTDSSTTRVISCR